MALEKASGKSFQKSNILESVKFPHKDTSSNTDLKFLQTNREHHKEQARNKQTYSKIQALSKVFAWQWTFSKIQALSFQTYCLCANIGPTNRDFLVVFMQTPSDDLTYYR